MADDLLRGSPRRRSSFSIKAEVLQVAKEGALKTWIMQGANLCLSQLNECLSLLLDWNLLEVVKASEKTIYKTTDKGLRYLRCYREIMRLLKKGKGNSPREANSLHLIKCGSRVTIER